MESLFFWITFSLNGNISYFWLTILIELNEIHLVGSFWVNQWSIYPLLHWLYLHSHMNWCSPNLSLVWLSLNNGLKCPFLSYVFTIDHWGFNIHIYNDLNQIITTIGLRALKFNEFLSCIFYEFNFWRNLN